MDKKTTADVAPIPEVVKFLRQRDYRFVKELGQGACGKTLLLHDDLIDQGLVCKKYVPYSETNRKTLFDGFVREVKLLHCIHHQNIVRVFNFYLYPDQFAGFILMEYIDGNDLDDFIDKYPEQINEVFIQTISGFAYLETNDILHRDIRPGNIMVREDGIVKIIDLGFGKKIEGSKDFEKSITLNWWCEAPAEFGDSRYDFATEVYFVGKLFEQLIRVNKITQFKYHKMIAKMCYRDPANRIGSFIEVERDIGADQFVEIDFTEDEMRAYQEFSEALSKQINNVGINAKYVDDLAKVRTRLAELYRNFMLEEHVPNCLKLIQCFVLPPFNYRPKGMLVSKVRDFIQVLKSCGEEKGRIILANLHSRLDAIPRHNPAALPNEDDIPF